MRAFPAPGLGKEAHVVGKVGELVHHGVRPEARDGPEQCVRVVDVTQDRLRPERSEHRNLVGRPRHPGDLVPGRDQQRDDPDAEDTARPGQEHAHPLGGQIVERRGIEPVHDAGPAGGVRPRAGRHAADLLDGAPRAVVLRIDEEDDAAHESKGVAKHQALQLPVVGAAPPRAREERPADFDLASLLVVAVKPRHPDHLPRARVGGDQGSSRRQLLAEEVGERGRLVAVLRGMLLPDERVGRDGVERGEVVGAQRPELDERSPQHRLKLEGHVARCRGA